MEYTIFNWLLEIPQAVGSWASWLVQPIYEPYIPVSPLGLLGITGGGVLLTLIIIHVVRLFLP